MCREVIDECRPRFMAILSVRYGWLPEGREQSITADELHCAVLGREAKHRGHAFFYFRDELATADMVEETPGEFRESECSDNAQKLADLKKAIATAGLPSCIHPAQSDATQKQLTGLEAFGNQVHAEMLQSLKNDPEPAARFSAPEAHVDGVPVTQLRRQVPPRTAGPIQIQDRSEEFALTQLVWRSRQGMLGRFHRRFQLLPDFIADDFAHFAFTRPKLPSQIPFRVQQIIP